MLDEPRWLTEYQQLRLVTLRRFAFYPWPQRTAVSGVCHCEPHPRPRQDQHDCRSLRSPESCAWAGRHWRSWTGCSV